MAMTTEGELVVLRSNPKAFEQGQTLYARRVAGVGILRRLSALEWSSRISTRWGTGCSERETSQFGVATRCGL